MVVAVLYTTVALGQTRTNQPIKTIRITGQVTDRLHQPIANAAVALKDAGSKATVAATTTEQNGRFTFHAMPPRSYDLFFQSSGFASLEKRITAIKDIELADTIMEVAPIESPIELSVYEAPIGQTVSAAVVSSTDLGQTTTNGPVTIAPCSISHRSGRRIVSNYEIVEFYVPRFAKMKKVRDIDYVEYYVRYGPERDKAWLKFMFGPMVGAQSPHDPVNTSIKWTAQDWGCYQNKEGTDWNGIGTDGRRWRLISIPFGFARYEGVPPKAAEYFDKILDTMCCGKDPYRKK